MIPLKTAAIWLVAAILPAVPLSAATDADRSALPISVDQAISAALAHSADLRHDGIEVRLSATGDSLDLRRWLPVIELGYLHNDSVAYAGADLHRRRIEGTITQRLYDRGRRIDDAIASRAETEQLAARRIDNRRMRITETIGIYVEFLRSQTELAILNETLQAGKQELIIVERQYQVGEITNDDLLDGQISLRELELSQEETLREERLAHHRLQRLVGSEREIASDGTINLAYDRLLPLRPPGYYLSLVEATGVEFRALRAELDALRRQIRRDDLAWIPTIDAVATAHAAGDRFPLDQIGGEVGFVLGFELPSFPITLSFRIGRQVDRERSFELSITSTPFNDLQPLIQRDRHILQRARVQYVLLREHETAEQIIRERLLLIEHRRSRLATLRDRQELEERRLERSRLSVSLGEARRLDLLNAEIEMARLRSSVIDQITELFDLELGLFTIARLPGIETSHRAIIVGRHAI